MISGLTMAELAKAKIIRVSRRGGDVLDVDGDRVQATVTERDALLRAAELLIAELRELAKRGQTQVPSVGGVDRLAAAVALVRGV